MKKLESRVFRSVSGEPNVVLNFRRSPESEFGFYTRPFHEGARVLARRALQRPGFRDLDALPILFLYRHALELSLKAIILEGNRRMDLHGDGLSQADLWKVLSGHRLTPLLLHVRRVFKFVGWKWAWNDPQISTFADVQRVLRDLEKIDPSSFAFRYPTNKRGQGSVPRHFAFSLRSFISVIDPLAEAFDTAVFGLSAEYGLASEAMSQGCR
jgi:hypothetical protein